MSRFLKFCCPACRTEFTSVAAAREHVANTTRNRAEHDIVATLPDIAFDNPDYGEKNGGWNWPPDGSPQGRALKPLFDYRIAQKEAAR